MFAKKNFFIVSINNSQVSKLHFSSWQYRNFCNVDLLSRSNRKFYELEEHRRLSNNVKRKTKGTPLKRWLDEIYYYILFFITQNIIYFSNNETKETLLNSKICFVYVFYFLRLSIITEDVEEVLWKIFSEIDWFVTWNRLFQYLKPYYFHFSLPKPPSFFKSYFLSQFLKSVCLFCRLFSNQYLSNTLKFVFLL